MTFSISALPSEGAFQMSTHGHLVKIITLKFLKDDLVIK